MSNILTNNIAPRSGDTINVNGNLSIGGTLTYEDVTNVDSIGVVTARNGLHVLTGNVGVGTTNPQATVDTRGSIIGFSYEGTDNAFRGRRFNEGVDGSVIFLDHSRSNTIGVGASLNDGDEVGAVQFRSFRANNTNINVNARIQAVQVGEADSGENTLTHLRFDTGGAERLGITSTGSLTIGALSGMGASHARLSIDCEGLDAIGDVTNIKQYGLAFQNDPTTDSANGIGFFNDGGQACGGYILHQDKGSNNLGDLVFGTAATSNNPVERVRITSDGGLFLGGYPGQGPTLHYFNGTINNGETFKIRFEGASNNHRGQHIFMISYCNHTNNSSNLYASTFILVIRDTATAGYTLELAALSSLFDNGPTITSTGNLTFTDNNDGSCVVGFPNKVGAGGNSGNTTVKATVQRLAGGFGAAMYPVSSEVS